MNEYLEQTGREAKEAEVTVRNLSTEKKNEVLCAVADKLLQRTEEILKANEEDVKKRKRKPYAGKPCRPSSFN